MIFLGDRTVVKLVDKEILIKEREQKLMVIINFFKEKPVH